MITQYRRQIHFNTIKCLNLTFEFIYIGLCDRRIKRLSNRKCIRIKLCQVKWKYALREKKELCKDSGIEEEAIRVCFYNCAYPLKCH